MSWEERFDKQFHVGSKDTGFYQYRIENIKKFIEDEIAEAEKRGAMECAEYLAQFLDDSPCSFDHHGYCQEHNFLGPEPGCGNADALKYLAALKRLESPKASDRI